MKLPPEKVEHENGGWHEDHHHGWHRTDGAFISLGTQVYIPGCTHYPKGTPGPLYVKPGTLTEGWDARMASHDATSPLPPPPPRCTQVWVLSGYGLTTHFMIARVADRPDGTYKVMFAGDTETVLWDGPSPNVVLVAGPGAPWAPMGGE